MYHSGGLRFQWSFLLLICDAACLILALPLAGEVAGFFLPNYLGADAVMPLPPGFQIALVGIAIGRLIILHSYAWPEAAILPLVDTRIFRAIVLAGIIVLFGKWSLNKEFEWWQTLWMAIYSIVAFGICIAARLAARWVSLALFHSKHFNKIKPLCRIAFVGWSSRLSAVLRKIASASNKTIESTVGYFAPKPLKITASSSFLNSCSYLGTVDDILKHSERHTFDYLIVDESILSRTQLNKIRDWTTRGLIGLEVIPSAFNMWLTAIKVRKIDGIGVLELITLPINRFYNQIIKRAIDIIGASVGLMISLPIISILGLIIIKESPGPIFYVQTRIGKNGRLFRLYKLRSMKLDAEQKTGAVWTKKNDPRRLRIGAFIRNWNLDELPQFWNILRGDMSLVGTRPERPEFVSQFKLTNCYYNLRHSCKPGLTGWAAVHGLRGNTPLKKRLAYDLYYIENWNVLLDFEIIALTFFAWKKNAY